MSASPIHAGLSVIAMSAVFLASCANRTRANIPAPPSGSAKPARIGTTEVGIASWYGVPYHGRRTASGETFDMEQLTAAHRTLPFNTWLEVTNLSNGKRVDVKVNDRGPFLHGRIIDLSLHAARDIDMVRAGTVKVRLKVIAPPKVTRAVTETGAAH
jgi:rare lipoprotein A